MLNIKLLIVLYSIVLCTLLVRPTDAFWALRANELVGKRACFVSKNYPDRMLNHHSDYTIWLDPYQDSSIFQMNSTFDIEASPMGEGVSIRPKNIPKRLIRHSGFLGYIYPNDCTYLFFQDTTFKPINGLADDNGVSFESVNYPKHYLKYKSDNFRLQLSTYKNTEAFKDAATWFPVICQ